MYLNTDTGAYPISEQEIRAAHPNTSFPQPFTPPEGYAWVFPAPPPTYNSITHSVREIAPVLTDKGHWEQRWEVLALPAETVAANQAARIAQIKASIEAATQARLESFAATRNYSSIESISKYKDITDAEIDSLPVADRPLVAKFRAESRYLALAAAQTWAVLYRGLADVEAGLRPMPSGYSEIESELPPLVWPV